MIFTKNFVAISLINLIVMTAYYLLFVISSPYAAERFAVTPSTAGLVAGLMLIGCLIGRFFTGRIIALAGFRKVLFVSIAIYTVSLVLYLVAGNLAELMVVRFIGGVGVGAIGTVTGTLVTYIVPPHMHGRGINYFSLSTTLALALGPFLGLALMRVISFSGIFLLCSAMGLVCFLIALLLSLPPVVAADAHEDRRFHLDDYIEYTVVPLAAVVMLVSVSYGCVQAFMAPYAGEIGLAGAASGFFLMYAAAGFCLRPFAGKLLDSRGTNIVIYPSLVIGACGFYLLSHVVSSPALLLSGVLIGAGISNLQTAAQTASIRMVTKGRFASATSTYYISLDLGVGLGPYALGFLVPSMGYQGLYMGSMALILLSIPLYYCVHGRKERTGVRRKP